MLWRHGRTTWNDQQRFQGQTDVPLDEAGRHQARGAADILAALRPDLIVTSDLRRAADTAAALGQVTGRAVSYDKDLRERNMGHWEGRTLGAVRDGWPGEWRVRQPADGETLAEVALRVEAALLRALDGVAPSATVVAVGHGTALRVGMARLLSLPEELWSRVGALANCCWSVLAEGEAGWRLVEHNAGTLPQPVRSDDR